METTSIFALFMLVVLSAVIWVVDWLNRILACCLAVCFVAECLLCYQTAIGLFWRIGKSYSG